MVILVIKIFLYSSSVYSFYLFLLSSASVRSIQFLSFMVPIFVWNGPLVSLIFLKRSLVSPILLFSSISLHWSLRKAFISLLAILWNSAFKWIYLSFSPLLFTSLSTATTNCGKFIKRWEYQTSWPASWEICMQLKKQQLEPDMEQQNWTWKNRTGHGITDWFQIGKGVCQGCILSPCLFNLYAEYIMRNARLDEG